MDVLLLKWMITESSPKMDVLLCFSLLQKTRQVTKILVLFFHVNHTCCLSRCLTQFQKKTLLCCFFSKMLLCCFRKTAPNAPMMFQENAPMVV
jgi:hypothetical protein